MKKSFKTKYLKKVVFTLALSVTVFSYAFISNASIIDDIKSAFGINNETAKITENSVISPKIIDDELDAKLTDAERVVAEQIESTVVSIREVDLDEIWRIFGSELKNLNIKDTEDFFDEYPESLNSLKTIFSRISVKITDIKTENDRIYAYVSIDHPAIKEVVSAIMPEVLLNNAGAFINNNITNENVNSILNSIRKAVEKSNMGRDKFSLDIEFKESNGRWVIANGDKIAKDVENHINDIESEITRNIR